MSKRIKVSLAFVVLGLVIAQVSAFAEPLNVPVDQILQLGSGTYSYESVSIAGTLVLGGTTTITVTGPGDPAFFLDASGIIKCNTTDGLPGADGAPYAPITEPGHDGIIGAAGVSGGHGQNGYNLTINVTGTARVLGIINVSGTNGSSGGNGGRGGSGHSGAADTSGTRGGDGGSAGNGGSGGNGGNFDIFVNGNLELVGAGISADGGIGAGAGSAGQGGAGGPGGSGHCTCGGAAGNGGNGGKAGEAGLAGRSGDGGAGGAISVRVTGNINLVGPSVSGHAAINASGGAAVGYSTAGPGSAGGDAGAPGGFCEHCSAEDIAKSTTGAVGQPGLGTDVGGTGTPGVPGNGGRIVIFADGRIKTPGVMNLKVDGGSAGDRRDQSGPGCAGKCPFDGCAAIPPMNGLPGGNGAHGGDGGAIEVRSKVGIDNVLFTSAVGGSGGPGGKGGTGGLGLPHGGTSTFTYGVAGCGGNGGTGGDGGSILFEAPLIAVTGEAKVSGAWGGERGAGGNKNAYDTTGSDGLPGQRGAVGRDGAVTQNLTTPAGAASDGGSTSDGSTTSQDSCPDDPDKTEPGVCGCGVADTDSDNDGTPDCQETQDTSASARGALTTLCGAPATVLMPALLGGLMIIRHSRKRDQRTR